MTWTYALNLLSASGVTGQMTRVRMLVGDTINTDPLLHDEEIYYVIGQQSATNYAAAVCAEMIAAIYARQVNTQNSELRISAAARYKAYTALADRLRKMGPGELPGGDGSGALLGTMYVGGSSVSAKEALDADTDLVKPNFSIGMDDYPDNASANRVGDVEI